MLGGSADGEAVPEVRLRFAAQHARREPLGLLLDDVKALYCSGPAGVTRVCGLRNQEVGRHRAGRRHRAGVETSALGGHDYAAGKSSWGGFARVSSRERKSAILQAANPPYEAGLIPQHCLSRDFRACAAALVLALPAPVSRDLALLFPAGLPRSERGV